MIDEIQGAADQVAQSLDYSPVSPSTRWRWGTVVQVDEAGTMTVNVAGTPLPGIRAARHCMGAQPGDRVRISYYGADAIVDAVRGSDAMAGIPTIDGALDEASTAAWLSALGLDIAEGAFEANSTNWTQQGETFVRYFGKLAQVNLVGVTKRDTGTWQNQTFLCGTLDRPCAYSKQYMTAMCQINSNWTLMQAGVNSSGEIRLRTLGTSIPSGTWVWIYGTYLTA